jgi:PAS domain S-box-containing protein
MLAPAPPTPTARDVLGLRFQITSGTLIGLVVLTATAVLVGWAFDMPTLKSVFAGFVTMKVNEALALLLTGVAVWSYRAQKFTRVRELTLMSCAGAASFIALLTLLEHLTGFNLHIDQLFVRDAVPGLVTPGRMSLGTSVSIILLNLGVVIADTPSRYRATQGLIAVVLLLGTLNLVGYLFGLEAFRGVASYSAMAVHTSLSLMALCLAVLFARPDEGLMQAVIDTGAGGLAIRQLLPVVFLLPLMLAWMTWVGVRGGLYDAGFAMACFVALAMNVLSYAVWAGGLVLRRFDDDRLEAEAERVRSEERLRHAVADAPIPMVIHDDADRILHMSRSWFEGVGYARKDAPTMHGWLDCAEPGGGGPVAAYLARIPAATDTLTAPACPVSTPGGDQRFWEFSTTPLGTIGTARRAFVTMAIDVTERRNAEANLRRMNESLEQRITDRTAELTKANSALKRQSDQLKEQATLLDLVRDGILVRDLAGTIVYWSAGAAEMYGWSSAEALGKSWHSLVQAEYGRLLADIEKDVLLAGVWEGEVTHTTRGGARLAVESRWTLTRNDRGVPQGFLEVNRDITARKRVDASLRDSEVRFRAVAETAIEGIISTDDRGNISYWNPGAERMFGWSAADAVGQPVSIALAEPLVMQQGAGAVGTTFETTGRRRTGEAFPLELSLAVWSNTQGQRFFTAIARDIAQRKEAERALRTKAEELARSNQELEQFAYVASHDLQEPLRMVANYTQLLARKYKDQLDGDANEFIDFAVDGAKRMQDLIHDLLQYARVGTRGKEFKPTPLSGVVADVMANLSSAVEEARADVVVNELPTVSCDATQMAQVFQNLIGNALKFRRAGQTPTVRVSAQRADGVWSIAVADNGIGIESKYFERIFQMFQRLHARSDYPGTGIGLALCRKIIERHGGRIRVESTPGQGTTFTFTLPDAR